MKSVYFCDADNTNSLLYLCTSLNNKIMQKWRIIIHQENFPAMSHVLEIHPVNELVEKVQFERRGENVNNRPTLMHDELQRYTDYIYNFVWMLGNA